MDKFEHRKSTKSTILHQAVSKKFIPLFLCGLLFCVSTLAEYKFKKITTKDGLSLDNIDCITQDAEGFLYFGTNALNVYDGNIINIHNKANTPGFGRNIKAVIPLSPSRILIGTLDKGLFLLDKKAKKIVTVPLHLNNDTLNLPILSLHSDNLGRIWIGTLHKGLYSIETTAIIHWKEETAISCQKYRGVENCEITSICSSTSDIWIGTRHKGLFSLSMKASSQQPVHSATIPLSSLKIWSLKAYGDSLFIGTEEGLNLFDLKTKKNIVLLQKPHDATLSNNIVRAICKDKSGTVWIGTQEDGLYSLQFKNHSTEIKHFKNIPTNSNTLNINKILSLYVDKHNNLWIGTWNGGVNILNLHSQQFINIRNKGKADDLSENIVWSIAEKEFGKYWIGTHGSGICSFEKNKSYFTEEITTTSVNSVSSLLFDEENKIIWAGTWGNGLQAFSYPDMAPILKYRLDTALLKNDRIYPLTKDAHGVLWIGTVTHGLFSLNHNDRKQPLKYFNYFKQISKETGLENAEIRTIIPDRNNVLWIGSLSNGLFKATTDDKGNISTIEPFFKTGRSGEDHLQIRTLYLDSKRNLWIGHLNGITVLAHSSPDSCQILSKLKNKIATGFIEDKHGIIWISTYNGLIRYNPENGDVRNYLTETCFYSLFYDDKNNQIHTGSNKGVFSFNPSKLTEDPFCPEVIFSGLNIFNKPVNPKEEIKGKIYLNKAFNYTDTLILPYSNNVFSMDITALSFASQNKNQLYYQLENFEKNWNERIGAATSVTYTNLSPGEYIFKVKAANKDNIWNPQVRKLTIIILPPWWKTNWAYAGYFVLFLMIAYTIYMTIKTRIRISNALKLEKIKKEQNDKLNELKLSFFTNISHDIRTPLTLILGPLENMLDNAQEGSPLHRQLHMMQKNANFLLQLINQVLDFRKIENDKIALKVSSIKLNEFILQTLGQFEGQAQQKNISLQFLSKNQNIVLWADSNLLRKILFNLISNAIRFTPDAGNIQVTIEENADTICIKIKDNGTGIAPNDLPYLFDRFYQSRHNKEDEGSGIGLCLVKKMVELHKGTIKVESQLGKGSEFIINFKNGRDHFNNTDIITERPVIAEDEKPKIITTHTPSSKQNKPTVIIIDDNDDIRHYIKDNLTADFNSFDFDNAADGLAMAQKKDVSLIICDIMMPGMDGLEFCEHIKSDLKTSHIPVILITAKTATESQIEGYEKGADDYICKPFSIKLLKTRIYNLIEQREKLQKKIKGLNLEPSNVSPTSLDEQFLEKTIQLIEENISNHEFSIENLSLALGLSHDNFYRKIKNLSGMSAAQFIRMIRLKRAAQMLDNTDYSISEILYEVGFTNPSYFAKCFKQQFGISAKEYQNERK
ncbi:MAG: response regulator [Marinilabiliaceae bacterium]|nr:response regulator [Marinilabiliaceae bacterium]